MIFFKERFNKKYKKFKKSKLLDIYKNRIKKNSNYKIFLNKN